MENILLLRCTIQEMGKLYVKFCFLYNGKYYDIKSLNVYDIFDGQNGVIRAEMLNEADLKAASRKQLNRRKMDLVNRVECTNHGVFADESLQAILNAENMSFVLYKCALISLDDSANVRFEEIGSAELGVMLNSAIYDIKTKSKVKSMNDDVFFGEVCLYSIKPLSISLFDMEDYMKLVLRAHEIIRERGKAKIICIN